MKSVPSHSEAPRTCRGFTIPASRPASRLRSAKAIPEAAAIGQPIETLRHASTNATTRAPSSATWTIDAAPPALKTSPIVRCFDSARFSKPSMNETTPSPTPRRPMPAAPAADLLIAPARGEPPWLPGVVIPARRIP